MVSIFDVAKYILEKQGRMSTWKLQKLCYYALAWHYTWTERRLFAENFQAYRNGPICPELLAVHKGMFMIDANELPFGNPDKLDADEKESLDAVIKEYGNDEPYYLYELTRSEDPWKSARGDLPKDINSDSVITIESMGEYYGSLIYD